MNHVTVGDNEFKQTLERKMFIFGIVERYFVDISVKLAGLNERKSKLYN